MQALRKARQHRIFRVAHLIKSRPHCGVIKFEIVLHRFSTLGEELDQRAAGSETNDLGVARRDVACSDFQCC